MKKISELLVGTALAILACGSASAMDKNVKIGVLNDMSGLSADIGGPNSVVAARMAIEDSGLIEKGWKIELISADHQNKSDVGANIARQWIDVEKVDVISDVTVSSVALAVNNLVRERNAILLNSGAGTSDLTNSQCSPNTIHWTFDTYMLAHGAGTALTKTGDKTWFFLTADYAFGTALQRDTAAAVEAAGGKVLGSVRHALNTADFSSFLLQAQASKSEAIGLANAGGDTINAIKQASEFGIIESGQKLTALMLFDSDVHALGLQATQHLNLTTAFYWNMNDGTRTFSKRFRARTKNNTMPTMVHAGVYSSLSHYFKALEAMGGNLHDGVKVVEKMKSMPTDDPLFGNGSIQPNGRKIHPAYLFEVKTPAESKEPWDYLKLVETVPANEAFTPLSKSTCPLLNKM